jgi:hypothetical protein
MSEINVGFRIDIVKRLLDATQKRVDKCDLSPLKTPSLIENFGSTSGNLMLLDIAIHDRKATQEQIKEFETLRNRHYNLERDFTNNCDCKKRENPI